MKRLMCLFSIVIAGVLTGCEQGGGDVEMNELETAVEEAHDAADEAQTAADYAQEAAESADEAAEAAGDVMERRERQMTEQQAAGDEATP